MIGINLSPDGKSLRLNNEKSSLTCQERVGVLTSASSAPSLTYCGVHITPIDANEARQYALGEINDGEAKAKAH